MRPVSSKTFAQTVSDQACAGLLACLLLLPAAVSAAAAGPAPKKLSVPELVRVIQGAKPVEEREKAILALTHITAEEERGSNVIETLLDIAKNQNGNLILRVKAIETLGQIQINVTADDKAKTKYRDVFIAILKNTKEPALARHAVAEVFKDTLSMKVLADKDKAYPVLVDVVNKNTEPLILRKECAIAIGNAGAENAIDVLGSLLNDADPEIKEASAQAIYDLLSKMGAVPISVPTVAKLVGLLQDKAVAVNLRVAVMKTLAQLIRENNVGARNGALAIILEAPQNGLSAAGPDFDLAVLGGIESLGIIASAEAIPALKKSYALYFNQADPEKKADVPVRTAVARALGVILGYQAEARTPDMKAVQTIRQELVGAVDKDPAAAVKTQALLSLRYLYRNDFQREQKDALDAILTILSKDIPAEVRDAGFEALKFISQNDYARDLNRWNKWFDGAYNRKRP